MEKISILGFFFVILCLITRDLACKGETLLGNCLRGDREALLDFKNGLKGSSNQFLSWTGANCCQWEGIDCENNTGIVISIDLHNPYSPKEAYENWSSMSLSGEIRPSLTELKSLKYLDLSGNSFEHISIPKFFGSLRNLHYLNLSNCGFSGAIPPNLGNLSNLQFLDLSFNGFREPLFVDDLEWMTSLFSLKHLKMNYVNLSMVGSQWVETLNKLPFLTELHLIYCGLSGPISSLRSINFTSLAVISISHNYFHSKFPIWFSNLSSLISLDVSHNQLYGQISSDLGELPNLQYLDLSGNTNLTGSCSQMLSGSWKKIEFLNLAANNFLGTIPSSMGNFCNLKYLDLGFNSLTGSLPEFLEEIKNCSSEGLLPNLKYLDLSNNQLVCRLPEWLGQLEALTHLDLFNNTLQGPIPASFGTFQNLKDMRLGQNELNGSLPVTFGQLSELVVLDVSWNHLTGVLSEEHFSKSSELKILKVDGNSGLVLNVSSTWVPPFQIANLNMDSCNLGPSFPTWLKFQKEVSVLELSNASISDSIPSWFWNISSQLEYLVLSFNQLQGQLPNQLNMTSLTVIDFNSNLFEGPIPLPNPLCAVLDLSNNKFSGSIPPKIGESMPHLHFLLLSGNRITGIIPESIGHIRGLQILDLSRNSLTGSIPSTISNCSDLCFLSLGKNDLSGTIPKSFGQLESLQSLHLDKNKLSGEVPLSFRNLSSLEILDLSYNKLWGNIPAWIGAAFTSLRILELRSNAFSGELLFDLSNLSSLHILDLAENNLSGSIPANLCDLKAMAEKKYLSPYLYWFYSADKSFEDSLTVKAKGQDLEYIESLSLVVSIDLSSNNFSGEFPKEITKLSSLMFLNLSRNHINGSIPQNISRLHELSSLDLSSNDLCGIIPSSMSSLTFLGYLNLSDNNFFGKIPFTGQMTTFGESAFAGNPSLCGPPLVAHCQGDDLDQGQGRGQGQGQGQSNVEDENDDGFIDQWFYLSIGLGFAVGILCPFFVLAIKKSWCEAYFNLVDKIVDKSLWLRRRRGTIGRNHGWQR